MSHLPLSLMNRLDQTESAVYQTLVAVFPKDPFSDHSVLNVARFSSNFKEVGRAYCFGLVGSWYI